MATKYLLLFVIAAVAATQTSNFIAIKVFSADEPLISALKAAAFTLPLAFLATIFFNLFYGSGHSALPYTSLNTIAIGLAILAGFLVNSLLGSSKITLFGLLGAILILLGVALIIFKGK